MTTLAPEVKEPRQRSDHPDGSPDQPMQAKHTGVPDYGPWAHKPTESSKPEKAPERGALADPTPPKSSDSSKGSNGNDAEVTSSASSTSKEEDENSASSPSPESDDGVPMNTDRPIPPTPAPSAGNIKYYPQVCWLKLH